ncbi:MAG TPA: disulfide bond formation protein B [Roseiarcus sp.]|jgi:disulfide bond formation protein DsbB
MLQVNAVSPDTRGKSAALIGAVAAAALAGAWIFQGFGIVPCELCLKQRIAYYGAVPLAAIVAYAATSSRAQSIVVSGLIGLALIFAVNAGLGIYHSGVEWAFWKGPDDCTGAIAGAPQVADFLKELQHIKVVRCDEVQIRILGLSLANWNVVISAALCALAARGATLRN